jgi:hypothetical protein
MRFWPFECDADEKYRWRHAYNRTWNPPCDACQQPRTYAEAFVPQNTRLRGSYDQAYQQRREKDRVRNFLEEHHIARSCSQERVSRVSG